MQEVDAIEIEVIELIDLGDATAETRQTYFWPIWYDSFFQLGQRSG